MPIFTFLRELILLSPHKRHVNLKIFCVVTVNN